MPATLNAEGDSVRPASFLNYAVGDYYIQDAGSLLPIALLDPKPGEWICDLCAAPGGKASAILESMKIPNLTILEMFQNVRSIVSTKSRKQQIPWESTSLTGNFYFNVGGNTTSEAPKEIQVSIISKPICFI
jgi:hypothetical protein